MSFSRTSASRAPTTGIASIRDGDVHPVAQVPVPQGAQPWLLPRHAELAKVAAAAAQMPLNLADAGWRVSTGPLVWNRRIDDLNPDAGTPVIWSGDFDGGILHADARRSPMRFMHLHSDKDRQVMTLQEPAILVQRTSSPEQLRRLTSVTLSEAQIAEFGGAVVIENHVNVLRPTRNGPLLSMDLLARLLRSEVLDAVARCISGSVALSAFELSALPLPDPATLETWESLGEDELSAAICTVYGMSLSGAGVDR